MPSTVRSRTRASAIAAVALACTAAACTPRPGWPSRTTTTTTTPGNPTGELSRDADPVVLTGSQVPALNGTQPGRIAAFRVADGAWAQIPVQVDERVDTRFHQIYNLGPNGRIPLWSTVNLNVPVNVYADPGTFTGPDTNPALDNDDEIVFMARDAGDASDGLAPPAGTTGNPVQVRVNDPDGGAAHVYLFRTDGSLDPGAGKKYVDYQFRLRSGDYKTSYRLMDGPNPEDSTITADTYRTHFSDRWVQDEMYLTKGDRPTRDLADRMKYHINLICARNENTFINDEGAFVVNKSGPVRALRGYIGSNSGPLTQNTHIFYDRASIIQTNLRVHAIPNVGAALDLSREAVGMTFRNPSVPNGVTVDGRPDNVPTNVTPTWWTYHGTQGGLAISTTFDTNATQPPGTVYEDNFNGSGDASCTGDRESIGMAGAHFRSWINCTDPGSGCPNGYLRSEVRWVATGQTTPAELQQVAQEGLRPLTVTVSGG